MPIDDFELEDGDRVVLLTMGRHLFRCDLRGAGSCTRAGEVLPETYDVSPDGRSFRIHGKGARDRVAYVSDVELRADLEKLVPLADDREFRDHLEGVRRSAARHR